VTSPSPGDGKTTISINLAAILAQAGKQVVLVDADLRRPNTHKTFGMSEKPGLTDVFLNYSNLEEVLKPVTQKGATGLRVLTSGTIPPNPNELLSSMRMDQVLKDLKEMSEVIIIDSPPSLVADATILASKVDGVVLVIQTGVTPIEAAEAFLSQLDRAGARILGVVMNNIVSTRGYYYYYYRGRYSYYYGEPDKQLAATSG
jgi:capsular exopolysaccharide synthesis family protein